MATPAVSFPLAPEQSAQLVSFAQKCVDGGALSRPEGLADEDCVEGLLDSATLLRFLTARRFDSDAALQQLKEAGKFRQDKELIRLYDVIEVSDFEQARQLYPHWTGRRDKNGLPICVFDIGKLDKHTLALWENTRNATGWSNSKADNPHMLQMASVFHDGFTRFVLPVCTMMDDRPNPSVAITSSVYLVDASSLGLKQGWSLKTFAQEISWLLSTCYPETISKIFVCNAPSYFATVWKYLKKWVDPNTAEKIVVLTSTEVLPTLEEHIDTDNIPKAFGGDLHFIHGMLPTVDDNIRSQFSWTSPGMRIPPGPIKLSQNPNGTISAIAVGGMEGVKRRGTIFSQA